MTTKKTWHILRSGSGGTKTATNRTFKLLENEFEGREADMIKKIKQIYVGTAPTGQSTKSVYEGQDQPELDTPITFEEVYAAAHSFRKNTAPGVDQVTNAMIRNLSDETLRSLTDFFNNTASLPKNGRKPKLQNRATSTTIVPYP